MTAYTMRNAYWLSEETKRSMYQQTIQRPEFAGLSYDEFLDTHTITAPYVPEDRPAGSTPQSIKDRARQKYEQEQATKQAQRQTAKNQENNVPMIKETAVAEASAPVQAAATETQPTTSTSEETPAQTSTPTETTQVETKPLFNDLFEKIKRLFTRD